MRIGFAGTPDFSVPTLEALLDYCAGRANACVAAVWTQPDRRAGRGRQLAASPVKRCAQRHGIPVLQPPTLRDLQAQAEVEAQALDILVVVAYGLILPQSVLDLPRLGCINVHASLLPRWRGAAPIQRAIAAGDRVSGVAIMQMEAGLDTGPVWRMASVPIGPRVTGGDLHDTLARLGADELLAALPAIVSGAPAPRPQEATFATYAAKLSKAEARVDWTCPAQTLADTVRAFNPWPVCDTLFRGRQLRIWAATALTDDVGTAAPGTVVAVAGDGLSVACGSGTLRLTTVQLAGGKAMPAADFANAHDCLDVTLGT